LWEWLKVNWVSILGSGGIGIIIVAIINVVFKGKSGSHVRQKISSRENSKNYQSGRDININTGDKKDDK
jgi:hypothetical protein